MLIETLIYIVILVLVLGSISYFMVQTYGVYRDTIVIAEADRVGVSLLNELMRETRSGASINVGASEFGTATGFVTINTADGGTKYFAYDGGRIAYSEDGGASSYYTPESTTISTFRITQLNTAVSAAVRYEIGITFIEDEASVTKTYRGLATLRRSYE